MRGMILMLLRRKPKEEGDLLQMLNILTVVMIRSFVWHGRSVLNKQTGIDIEPQSGSW